MVEFWTTGLVPAKVEHQAEAAEAAGWDGMAFFDSQNLGGDCYVGMALAARATSRLKIGTGVTNPFTRHPAVVASAAATIQYLSRGRLTLGIGRGDSANAYVGFGPSSVGALTKYIKVLRRYLHREGIPFEEVAEYGFGAAGDIHDLHLADHVKSSRLEWWAGSSESPPPIDVAASGPKVISVGALHADSVSLTVGADTRRVRWGVDIAKKARAEASRGGDFAIGAYVNVVCHPDRSVALDLVRGPLASFARFSIMQSKAAGPLTKEQDAVFERLAGNYDMTHHGQNDSSQTSTIEADFADQYAIIGPAKHCVERLQELVDAGVTRFILSSPVPGAAPHHVQEARHAQEYVVNEVLPAFR